MPISPKNHPLKLFLSLCFAVALIVILRNGVSSDGLLASLQGKPGVLPSDTVSGHQPHFPRDATDEVLRARRLVREAIAASGRMNRARMHRSSPRRAASVQMTPEVSKAAALLAEIDARESLQSGPTSENLHPRDGVYWMESIARKGTSPYSGNVTYQVFRNVKDFGAKGDGTTDDTAAIMRAMSEGNRCAAGCYSSSTNNAVVYLPPGQYLVSSNITLLYGTQFISDPTRPATIKAAASFVGLGVLSTDSYVGDGTGADGRDNEWYVSTANFYRQIRNVKVDITATDPNTHVCGIHWQVAQATSLQNVEIIAQTNTTQIGIYAENGSGGFMSDVTFTGGSVGFYGGNQQFTAQRLTFNGCDTAIQILWNWGWVWKSVQINNAKVGFNLAPTAGTGNIGSVSIIDSAFTNVGKAVIIDPPSSQVNTGTTGMTLSNVAFSNVQSGVIDTKGKELLSASASVDNWFLGPVYNTTANRTWTEGMQMDEMRNAALLGPVAGHLPNAPYFERARPQYEYVEEGFFIHLKDLGARGDGVTDDTDALNTGFRQWGVAPIVLFADAGVYMISDTLILPAGARLVGEAWPQFVAFGPKFNNASEPRALIQIGRDGDVGSVEIQDIIFTTKGLSAGVILVRWNIKADKLGSAGLWDCHVRVGGALGTALTHLECPAATDGSVPSKCLGAAMMMHVTANASGYFENMWLDDKLTDDKNSLTQTSVYTARGMLVESTAPVWLYAVAAEHAVFYQLNFDQASTVYAGLLQTESPYFQPNPAPPAPFDDVAGVFPSDPWMNCTDDPLSGCDASFGLIMTRCANIHIVSGGFYSWFKDYKQDCVATNSCQEALISLSDNYAQVRLEQIITIGANNSLVDQSVGLPASADQAVSGNGTSWSQISLYDTTVLVDPMVDIKIIQEYLCNRTDVYGSLEELSNDAPNLPYGCAAEYALPVLGNMLSEALTNYTSTSNGYEDKFDAYVRYIKALIPTQIDKCMEWTQVSEKAGPCNQYFTCIFNPGHSNGSSGPCPPPNTDFSQYPSWQTYYTLVNDTGLYAELENNFGVDKAWVTFGESHTPFNCTTGQDGCIPEDKVQFGFPVEAPDIVVPNPRDIFTNASNNFAQIQVTLYSLMMAETMATWDGNETDIAEVLVMPVSMAYQAAQAIEQVVLIGGEVEDAERKNLIVQILSAVFLVVPFVGDGLGAAASDVLQFLGRAVSLVGGLGNGALATYEIVNDPSTAPMQIMGMLAGVGGVAGAFGRTSKDMATMADIRRNQMKDGDLEKLGTEFKRDDGICAEAVHVLWEGVMRSPQLSNV